MKKLIPAFFALAIASCDTAKQSTASNESIVGKHWRLVELYGKIVQQSALNKDAHLLLDADEKRISGSGGCNSFFGGYELPGNNSIQFLNMGATKMACPGNVMQVEQEFFEALGNTTEFVVKKDTLLLLKQASVLAKFVVSDTR